LWINLYSIYYKYHIIFTKFQYPRISLKFITLHGPFELKIVSITSHNTLISYYHCQYSGPLDDFLDFFNHLCINKTMCTTIINHNGNVPSLTRIFNHDYVICIAIYQCIQGQSIFFDFIILDYYSIIVSSSYIYKFLILLFSSFYHMQSLMLHRCLSVYLSLYLKQCLNLFFLLM